MTTNTNLPLMDNIFIYSYRKTAQALYLKKKFFFFTSYLIYLQYMLITPTSSSI